MAYTDISSIPFLRGFRVDAFSCLHVNVVEWEGRQLLFYAATDDRSSNGGVKTIMRVALDPDGFNDATGVDYIAPANLMSPTHEPTTPVAQLNTFGFPFDIVPDAVNTNGTYPRYTDLTICEWQNGAVTELRMFCYVTNHPTDLKNHVGMLKSVDGGLTWSLVGEVLNPAGGNQGTAYGMVARNPDDNSLWGICTDGNGDKLLRSSLDGGWTWAEHGVCATLGTTIGSNKEKNATSMPVGRGFFRGDYVYAYLPDSRDQTDWPQYDSMWWLAKSDLPAAGSTGTTPLWIERECPITAVSTFGGGRWQPTRFIYKGAEYIASNQWGVVGEENAGTADLSALYDTPYYKLAEDYALKNIYISRLDWTGLFDNPDWYPLTDGGRYTLENNGRYLAVDPAAGGVAFGDNAIMVDDPSDQNAIWQVKLFDGFAIFLCDQDPTLGLRHAGFNAFEGARTPGTPVEIRSFDGLDAGATDYRFMWWLNLVGGQTPNTARMQNMHSRLWLKPGGILGLDQGSVRDLWRFKAV